MPPILTASCLCGGLVKTGNSKGAEPLTYRVIRGGNWNNNENNCRVSNRNNNNPTNRNNNIGFRLALHFHLNGNVQPGIAWFTDYASVVWKVLVLFLSSGALIWRIAAEFTS